MIAPLKDYESMKTQPNVDKDAYETLFTKYITKNLKGDKKLNELDSTNQEDLLKKVNGGRPFPGMVYTFMYKGSLEKILLGKKEVEFSDVTPLVFCYNVDKTSFNGINFNMLPPKERAKFLQAYYDTYSTFFNKIEELTQNDKNALNLKYIELVKNPNLGLKMLDIFNKRHNSNFGYAFRKYNYNNIIKLRMVEVSEWKYIPFYKPNNTLKNINEPQIQRGFLDSLVK